MRERRFSRQIVEIALLAVSYFVVSVCTSWARSDNFRVGVLTPGVVFEPVFAGLREGLDRLGYNQGKNVTYVIEDTKGDVSKLINRAKKLLEAKPDVLFAVTTPHAIAAKQATTTDSIVFAWVGDPVRSGLVASYADSQNNLTGVASYSAQLSGKRLEVLKEIAPRTKRILAFVAARDINAQLSLQFLEETADKLRVQVLRREVMTREDIERAIGELRKGSVDAIYYVPSTLVGANMDLLVRKSKDDKIPLVANEANFVKQGALLAYGADFRRVGTQAARLMAKILRGEKPSDIPSETPEKLWLVVNMTTAKTIDFKFPRQVLDRVDSVVQ